MFKATSGLTTCPITRPRSLRFLFFRATTREAPSGTSTIAHHERHRGAIPLRRAQVRKYIVNQSTSLHAVANSDSNQILQHTYNGRPPPASVLLPLYLAHASPRPSLIYLTSTNPPILLYSIIQDRLLFLSPCSTDTEPLLVLEFLHRVAYALEEFLGSPLLASKIQANYDVVAQILSETADAGVVIQGEANALRDVVETGPGTLQNLLGNIKLSGSAPALGSASSSQFAGLQRPTVQPALSSQGSAVPWRRSNVRHTSNELYVDIVETLSVILAPSGRPLSAFAYGSIAFTSKVSGVPDLLLTLSTGGKGGGMGNRGDQLRQVMERAVFHPCVRLNKWKADGVLSFVPPDGRFALCGYESDLLGPEAPLTGNSKGSSSNLNLPASLDVQTGLGTQGNEFEVRLSISPSSFSGKSAAAASLQSNLARPGAFRTGSGGDSKATVIENLVVHVPIAPAVRSISDIRPSKGEAHWNPADGTVEWRINAKAFSNAVLRCTVLGPLETEDDSSSVLNGMTTTTYDYDEDQPATYQSQDTASAPVNGAAANKDERRVARNAALMPSSATMSFSVKGWLASGLRVESLLLDTKKSRGLGADVKPYKGVKYLTVSTGGVEVRC